MLDGMLSTETGSVLLQQISACEEAQKLMYFTTTLWQYCAVSIPWSAKDKVWPCIALCLPGMPFLLALAMHWPVSTRGLSSSVFLAICLTWRVSRWRTWPLLVRGHTPCVHIDIWQMVESCPCIGCNIIFFLNPGISFCHHRAWFGICGISWRAVHDTWCPLLVSLLLLYDVHCGTRQPGEWELSIHFLTEALGRQCKKCNGHITVAQKKVRNYVMTTWLWLKGK